MFFGGDSNQIKDSVLAHIISLRQIKVELINPADAYGKIERICILKVGDKSIACA